MVLESHINCLEDLEEQWNIIWKESENPDPFQSFPWHLALHRVFGNGSEFLLLRDGKRPLGIVAISGGEKIVLAGNGISDYQGACVVSGYETMFRDFFFDELGKRLQWRQVSLDNLPAGSLFLEGKVEDGLLDATKAEAVCPVLDLTGTARDEFPLAVPRGQIEKIRYYRRRAERAGVLEFKSANNQTVDAYLDGLFRLHGMRWGKRGESGVLEGKAIQDFHRIAARGLLKLAALRLYGMFLNKEMVGVYLGYVCGELAFYYLSGFNPEVAELSPGTLLVGHAIEEAAREGARTFDFLRGSEPYKYKWGASDTQTFRRQISRV
jgi:CelD/BcsL family acetyltransferase involved in cellulose biosynthesis